MVAYDIFPVQPTRKCPLVIEIGWDKIRFDKAYDKDEIWLGRIENCIEVI